MTVSESGRQSAARTLDRALRGAAVRSHRAPPFPSRLRDGAEGGARGDRRHRRRPRAPDLRQHDRGARAQRAALDRVASVFFNLVGRRHPTTNSRRSSATIAPVLSRHRSDTYLNDALFRRIDALKTSEAALGLTPEQARALRALSSRFRPRRRRAAARGQGAARRDRREARDARRRVRPERARRREGLDALARRGRSRRPSGLLSSRARRGLPPSAASPAATPSRSRAPASSRSCSSPRAAICARPPFAPGPRAARTAARPTIAPSPPRRCACAPSAQDSSATKATPTTASPTRWRRRREAALDLLESVWAPGAAAGRREAEALQAIVGRARAAISRSRPGTGATSPRSAARPSSISTRAR